MPLALEVTMVTPHYPAARTDDRTRPEWPPHPGRVFCALVASHRDEDDLTTLRRLEQLQPPRVHVPEPVEETHRASYVVTNRRESAGGHQAHPARTALERSWEGISTAGRFVLVWDDAPDDLVASIDQIAARVPYLGRSTGVAILQASTGAPSEDLPETYEPCDLVAAEVDLRVPYAGYVDDLVALHVAGRSAWEAARTLGYRRRRRTDPVAAQPEAIASVFPDLVVLRFDGVKPAGRLLPLFTRALRLRVMRDVPDPLPAALHGHDPASEPHVAFLGLPVVGSQHSDGHLLGMAVALPTMPAADRVKLVRALRRELEPGSGVFELDVDGVGSYQLLTHDPVVHTVRTLDPRRWRRGSRTWVTATPVVLDRFPKGGDVAGEVRRTVTRSGLPEPVDVEVATRPLTGGAVDLHPRDLPSHLKGRLYRHVRLSFPVRVTGPVLAGAGRYCGLGLFSPESEAWTGDPTSGLGRGVDDA